MKHGARLHRPQHRLGWSHRHRELARKPKRTQLLLQLRRQQRGNCYDNAMVETVFKTIKAELIWRTIFATRDQANKAIGQFEPRLH